MKIIHIFDFNYMKALDGAEIPSKNSSLAKFNLKEESYLLLTFRFSISNPFRLASQTKHNSCFLLPTTFSLSYLFAFWVLRSLLEVVVYLL